MATEIFTGANSRGQCKECPPRQNSYSLFLDTINYSEVAPDPPKTPSGAHIKVA